MPYICLARHDLPEGVVQILSLTPNSSQRHPGYDPPGQTRYLNRVAVNPIIFDPTTGEMHTESVGLIAYLVDRVEPDVGGWTYAAQVAVANAITARLDAGQSLLVAEVNAIVAAQFGTDFDGSASNSTGVLIELLDILAGRGYVLPAGYIKGPAGSWSGTQRGNFTRASTVFGTTMIHGEIRPVTLGGDIVQLEVRGITETYVLMNHIKSVGATDLVCFSGGSPQISAPTLWPDSDRVPHYPWQMQGDLAYTTVTNARVITIYDADGSVL